MLKILATLECRHKFELWRDEKKSAKTCIIICHRCEEALLKICKTTFHSRNVIRNFKTHNLLRTAKHFNSNHQSPNNQTFDESLMHSIQQKLLQDALRQLVIQKKLQRTTKRKASSIFERKVNNLAMRFQIRSSEYSTGTLCRMQLIQR